MITYLAFAVVTIMACIESMEDDEELNYMLLVALLFIGIVWPVFLGGMIGRIYHHVRRKP